MRVETPFRELLINLLLGNNGIKSIILCGQFFSKKCDGNKNNLSIQKTVRVVRDPQSQMKSKYNFAVLQTIAIL